MTDAAHRQKRYTGFRVTGLVMLYVIMGILTFGAVNAHLQYECHHEFSNVCDSRMVRGDRTFAVLTAILPVAGWATAVIVTAGWEDGISFSATPDIAPLILPRKTER